MKNQKALNNAFYATLVMVGLSLITLILGYVALNWQGLMVFILFPTLGYLTKRGNKKAVIVLMALFILDRIALFINLNSRSMSIVSMIFTVWWSFYLWFFFYKAYLVIKELEKSKVKQ